MRTPPPTIDPATYRATDPALAALDDAAAIAHYRTHGREKGVVASPLALRENLLAFIDDDVSVLEIGPFFRPLKRGPNVEYLDVLTAEQLRERATKLGIDPNRCPPHIHHVGGIEQVERTYDAVLSAHVIEHQPDLVTHLQQVERLLKPGGGYFLIIPDKRYCFDHFIPESSLAGVIQAYDERRTTHTLASMIEHFVLTTHNDPERHWRGDHGREIRDRRERLEFAYAEYARRHERYIDVHSWYFTPPVFRAIVATLKDVGLIGLEIAGLYHPAYGRNEFCAILKRTA